MVIVMNMNLKMGIGKTAAQVNEYCLMIFVLLPKRTIITKNVDS